MGKIPKPLLYVIFFAIVAVNGALVWRDVVKPAAFDYCAAANIRTCTVSQHGDWTLLTSGTHAYLLLMKDGKVVQVSQVQ